VSRVPYSIAAFVAALSIALPSSAQESPTADELFQKGREAAKRGDQAAACAFFGDSYTLDPAVGTLFNLAYCEENLGRVATAWTHYKALESRVPANDARLEAIRERLSALEPRLPKISLTLSKNCPPDTKVFADDEEIPQDQLGKPIHIDPGRHNIEVHAPGRETASEPVIIRESEVREIVLEPGAVASAEPPPPEKERPKPARVKKQPRPAPAPSAQKKIGWGFIGLGAAGFVTTAVAAAFVLDRKATVKDECKPGVPCTEKGKNAAESGKVWSTVGTVAFIVGAAAGGAGTYLVLTAPTSDRRAGSLALHHAF
jgi:hypothetical protein